MNQDKFDMTIGRLDRILSELMEYSRQELDNANKQTLKHHAEDMASCAESILKRLNVAVPQIAVPASQNVLAISSTFPWLSSRWLDTNVVQFYHAGIPTFGVKADAFLTEEQAIRAATQQIVVYLAKSAGCSVDDCRLEGDYILRIRGVVHHLRNEPTTFIQTVKQAHDQDKLYESHDS